MTDHASTDHTSLDKPQPFSRIWNDLFPRWKLCVVIFFALTIATVFVPSPLGWAAFCLASAVCVWRGYRAADIPLLFEVVRVAVIGTFIGSLIWSVAGPLQRHGLIRVSRDVRFMSPEVFACCIWDGKSREPEVRPSQRDEQRGSVPPR